MVNLHYMGKLLEDMTKEELILALEHLYNSLTSELRRRTMLLLKLGKS